MCQLSTTESCEWKTGGTDSRWKEWGGGKHPLRVQLDLDSDGGQQRAVSFVKYRHEGIISRATGKRKDTMVTKIHHMLEKKHISGLARKGPSC